MCLTRLESNFTEKTPAQLNSIERYCLFPNVAQYVCLCNFITVYRYCSESINEKTHYFEALTAKLSIPDTHQSRYAVKSTV